MNGKDEGPALAAQVELLTPILLRPLICLNTQGSSYTINGQLHYWCWAKQEQSITEL